MEETLTKTEGPDPLRGDSEGAAPRRGPVWLRILTFIVVPTVFVGFIGFGLFKTKGPKVGAGSSTPEFSLPSLDGKGYISSSEIKGNPVVINFWASWCVPCREEAPTLEAAWRKYKDQGVVFLGVNVQDSEEDAEEFVREFGITYPNVRDVEQSLSLELGVTGLPETFFVDHGWTFVSVQAGEVLGSQGPTKILGAIRPTTLRERIESLLELQRRER